MEDRECHITGLMNAPNDLMKVEFHLCFRRVFFQHTAVPS